MPFLLGTSHTTCPERDLILERVWGNASYANSLALNVQITYLRRMLSTDSTLTTTSLKKRGYVLEVQDYC
ncbi:MAG: winged helix-turn-helix domain-containing protein [Bacteroidaceae bacterium]|nr:winged helix-turn-helix domain-containing protein [Bacteroidaceae bacterium]